MPDDELLGPVGEVLGLLALAVKQGPVAVVEDLPRRLLQLNRHLGRR